MARIARIVAPGFPHHVTQRGSRRQQTFFTQSDYRYYIDLLKESKIKSEVSVWAYCLMPNHVHLIVVPRTNDGLARFLGPVHRKYALAINHRMEWQGHLWQERFHSFVMDERHLLAVVRYVELNPVRARLCHEARDWRWSSARAHLSERDDGLVDVDPMIERVGDWKKYIEQPNCEDSFDTIRQHILGGRPLGDDKFLRKMELVTNRRLRKLKPGPKPKN